MPSNPRILVIEDEMDAQEVIRSILVYNALQVDAVEDVSQAVEKMRHNPYQLIITDVALPEMDGVTFVRQIRKAHSQHQLAIVVVTAYHSSALKQEALQAGANAYFTKPLEGTTFPQQIQRLLESVSTQDEV